MRTLGPYILEEELGRGGMGAVFRARRTDGGGPPVALKLLSRFDQGDPDLEARFAVEGEALLRLRHPHIVGVVDVGSTGPTSWIAMELVDGRTLEKGPLPPADALERILPICDAVAHAHAQGILHRDLKPGNVLIRAPDDHPLLTDFGLARRLDASEQLTRTGEILGSPGYMAPEQCGTGDPTDARTDVYGLGALLYALLTGVPPCRAATPFATLYKVLETPPAPPSSLAPDVGPRLDAVVLKALAKAPADRHASAEAFAAELRAATHLPRRRSRALALAVFAVAALTAGLLWTTARAPREPAEPEPSAAPASPPPVVPPDPGVATSEPAPAERSALLLRATQAFAQKRTAAGLAAAAEAWSPRRPPQERAAALLLATKHARSLKPAQLRTVLAAAEALSRARGLGPIRRDGDGAIVWLTTLLGMKTKDPELFERGAQAAQRILVGKDDPEERAATRANLAQILARRAWLRPKAAPDPRAIWNLVGWLTERPDDPHAHRFMAQELFRRDLHAATVPHLTLALQSPELTPVIRRTLRIDRARGLLTQDRQAEAAREARALLRHPELRGNARQQVLGVYARAQLELGRHAEALAALEAAPSLLPQLALLRALALCRLGRTGDALAIVDRLPPPEPFRRWAVELVRGWHAEATDPEQARRHYRGVLELRPPAEVALRLARLALDRGDRKVCAQLVYRAALSQPTPHDYAALKRLAAAVYTDPRRQLREVVEGLSVVKSFWITYALARFLAAAYPDDPPSRGLPARVLIARLRHELSGQWALSGRWKLDAARALLARHRGDPGARVGELELKVLHVLWRMSISRGDSLQELKRIARELRAGLRAAPRDASALSTLLAEVAMRSTFVPPGVEPPVRPAEALAALTAHGPRTARRGLLEAGLLREAGRLKPARDLLERLRPDKAVNRAWFQLEDALLTNREAPAARTLQLLSAPREDLPVDPLLEFEALLLQAGLAREGDPAQAARAADAAIRLAERLWSGSLRARALLSRALGHRQARDLARATRDLTDALQTAPPELRAPIQEQRAELLLQRGRLWLADALDDALDLIRLEPQSAVGHDLAARAHQRAGPIPAAIQSTRRALARCEDPELRATLQARLQRLTTGR